MTNLILTTPSRRTITASPFSVLRLWVRNRSARVAIDQLDEHMRRDIGLPTRGDRTVSPHEAAARLVLMNLR